MDERIYTTFPETIERIECTVNIHGPNLVNDSGVTQPNLQKV